MSHWALLPDEIIKLIFHRVVHPMETNVRTIPEGEVHTYGNVLLLMRLLNRENAAKFRLVPRMHHPDKAVQARAVVDACADPFFETTVGFYILYIRTYTLCTSKQPMNFSADLYKTAVAFLESECATGEVTYAHIGKLVAMCMYLDRSYTRRRRLKSVEEVAADACKKYGIVSSVPV